MEAEEEASLKNYESDLDEGGSSVGSIKTNYANDADYEGPLLLGPTSCRVLLGAKTDLGEEVCCAAPSPRTAPAEVILIFGLINQLKSHHMESMWASGATRIGLIVSSTLAYPKPTMPLKRLETVPVSTL